MYGGTKEEMARLVKDAAALTEVQKELGITVNENDASFGNIVNAISVVQAKMGIMGTTSEEAAKTISGSISSMKSAWSNLVVGIADESADADTLINNFVESVATVGDNLLPRIEVALGGIGKLVEELAPVIVEALPKLVTTVLPPIANATIKLLSSIGTTISKNSKKLLKYGVDLLNNIMVGITETIPELSESVEDIVIGISDFIEENAPTLISTAVSMIVAIAEGLANSVENLIPTIVGLISFVATELTKPETLVPIAESAIDIIVALGNGLVDSLPYLIESLPEIVDGLVNSIIEFSDKISDAGIKLMGNLFENTPEILKSIGKSLPALGESIGKLLLESIPLYNIGKQLIEGINKGMNDEAKKGGAKKSSKSILDSVKDFFQIKSPSRLFRDRIGKMLVRGIGVGFDDEMGNLQKLINDDLDELNGDIETNMSYGSYDGIGVGASGTTISGVEINIYADQAGDSAESIADAVAVALQDLIDRRSAVYA